MFSAFARCAKTRFLDALRHARVIREAAALGYLLRGRLARDDARRAANFARVLNFTEIRTLARAAVRQLGRSPGLEESSAAVWSRVVRELPRYRTLVRERPALDRSVILKAPAAGGEKGILLMTFEYNWVRLLLGLDEPVLRWLDEHFTVVLSTSWSPTDYAALALAVARLRGTVFVQSCNFGEIARIEGLHPRLKCLPTLPCDWINPDNYVPLPPEQRDIDFVMVANWGEFKRHWDFFRALSRMPANLKVVLIGQRESGRTQEDIRKIARDCGARQELDIHESIPIQQVAALQCRAKVSVIMSRREGCCVAAVESLFAGCALAMREDAHVGPLAYIHEQTGRRLRRRRMAEDLMELLQAAAGLLPQKWAQENLACQVSRSRVNAQLRQQALAEGLPWTRDLVLPQWRPHPTFAHEDEKAAMRPVYEDLHRRAPQVFTDSLIDTSWK